MEYSLLEELCFVPVLAAGKRAVEAVLLTGQAGDMGADQFR